MDPEDLEPQREKPKPRDLEAMSLEALEEYIAELETEIARIRGVVAAKEEARAGAESVFKK